MANSCSNWNWAQAYERHGLRYYPKLVGAIPYTPATGPRLLLAPGPQAQAVATALAEQIVEEARRQRLSSIHWLFLTDSDLAVLGAQGLLRRVDCQFHWHNPGYRDFDDFLDSLTAKRRKNIRRERRLVQAAGLTLETLPGHAVSEAQWHTFHRFYRSTFQRLGGSATLTLPFFQEIGITLGDQVVLMLARAGAREVAGALSFCSAHTLYGRHWGCAAHYDNLHFETCYYQGIDYCIRLGLQRFEPGAQGEHKILPGLSADADPVGPLDRSSRFSRRHCRLLAAGNANRYPLHC